MIGITRADGSVVRVSFVHRQKEVVKGEAQQPIAHLHPERKKNRGPIRAYTFCVIETGTKEAPVVLSIGTALCAMADNFEKEAGRVIALDDALNEAIIEGAIDHTERGALLSSYYNRPRGVAQHVQTPTTDNANPTE